MRDLLDPLHAVLFKESSPIPVKAALAGLGLCSDEMRLPLTRASLATQERLLAVIQPVVLGARGAPASLRASELTRTDANAARTETRSGTLRQGETSC